VAVKSESGGEGGKEERRCDSTLLVAGLVGAWMEARSVKKVGFRVLQEIEKLRGV